MKNFIALCFCFLLVAAKAQEQKKYYLLSEGFNLQTYESENCKLDSSADVVLEGKRVTKYYYTSTFRRAFIDGELKNSMLAIPKPSSPSVKHKVDIYTYSYSGVGYNTPHEDIVRKYGATCYISPDTIDFLINSQKKTFESSFTAVGLDFGSSLHSQTVETCTPLDLNVLLNLPAADNPFSDKWFVREKDNAFVPSYVDGSIFSSKRAGSFLVGLDLNLSDFVEMLPDYTRKVRRKKLFVEIPLTVNPSTGPNITAGQDRFICFFSEKDNNLSPVSLNGYGESPTTGLWSVVGVDPRAVKMRGSNSFLDKNYLSTKNLYTLHYKGFNENGCQFEATSSLYIDYYPFGIKNLSLKSTPYDTGLVAVQIVPSIVPDDYFKEHIWRINDKEINTDCPKLVYPFYTKGNYKIELQGILSNGCRYTMTHKMTYSPEQEDAYKPSEDFLSLIKTKEEEK